jgi:hypothetical protein
MACSVLLSVPALAQQANQRPATPSPVRVIPEPGQVMNAGNIPPVLRTVMERTPLIVSLGEVPGLPGVVGYLAESNDGNERYQVFYVMPDGRTMLIGVVMRLGNQVQPVLEHVTAAQVLEMQRRVETARAAAEAERRRAVDAAEAARRRAEEAAEAARRRAQEVANNQSRELNELEDRRLQAEAAARHFQSMTPFPQVNTSELRVPDTAPVSPATQTPNSTPAPVGTQASNQFISALNQNQFMADVSGRDVMWFDLGAANAPMLVMVADPRCQFCHRAWQDLRPLILERRLRVRVILIAGNPNSQNDVISILSREEPGRAFWLGEGSSTQPVDPPPATGTPAYARGQEALRMNQNFVQKYGQHIQQTPFFAYMGADNRLRSLSGLENLSVFLSGIPPSNAAATQGNNRR